MCIYVMSCFGLVQTPLTNPATLHNAAGKCTQALIHLGEGSMHATSTVPWVNLVGGVMQHLCKLWSCWFHFCVLSNCMHGCSNIWNQTLHLELRLVHCPTPKNRLPPGSVNHASCCGASGRLHANSHGVYTAHIHAHMATHHRRHMNPNKPQCVCMHLAD